jgi:hypothetical protein
VTGWGTSASDAVSAGLGSDALTSFHSSLRCAPM